jgi:hypothetical protein
MPLFGVKTPYIEIVICAYLVELNEAFLLISPHKPSRKTPLYV